MDDPQEIGEMMGGIIWSIVALIGIIKCFSIARRETTSALCVHSLTLTLLAYLLIQGFNVLKALLPKGMSTPMGALAFFGIALMLFVASFTLAIIGLALYRRSFAPDGTKREFVQGKKQAIWAMVLNCILTALFVVGFVGGLRNRDFAHQLASKASQSTYEFQEENFRLTPPGGRWVEMDPETINPESSVLIMRGNPQMFATVIAERPGIESGMKVEQLVEVAQSNMRSVAPETVFSSIEPYTVNGLPGQRYSADATVSAFKASYVSWCCVRNGYCYQVIMWAGQNDKNTLMEMADSMLQGFDQIDPDKRYFASGAGPFGMRGSSFFGYTVDLQDTDWLAWKDLNDFDALADEGGVHPDGTRFCVVPMTIPAENVSTDLVHEAFLKLYEYGEPLNENEVEAISAYGMKGLVYSYSNGENHCVEQLLISTNCAYLVSAWAPGDQADGLRARADKLFKAVSFQAPAGDYESVMELPADRQAAQGTMINKVGLGYYEAGRFPEALEWFNAGFACDTTNAIYFGNMLAARAQMNQNKEGLALLETVSADILENPNVISWKATLLVGDGQVEEADKVYAALFASGHRDDDDFMQWTRLRADNGMWEGLDEIFTGYLNAKPSVALQTHQLDLYYAKGDYRKVATLARRFLDEQGFSQDVAYWYIDACDELGEYNEALAVCNELLAKGYTTVSAYQKKALCEYRLNWYRQSKASLEKALELNPRNETTQEWLATISAELGEGDNSSLKAFIEPVVLPAVFAEMLNEEPEDDFGQEFGAYYSRFHVLWYYDESELLKRTDSYHIKVLDNAGVSTYSSLEFAFNPVSQEIFVNELLVRDDKGGIVGRGAVKDYYIKDDDSDGLVSEDKKLVLPVPGLEVGCSIEVAVTRAYSDAPDEFYFKRHFLAAGYPVLNAAVFLGGDAESVVSLGVNGVDEIRREEGVLWRNAEPYTYKWEPLQLPAERFVPAVRIGSSSAAWDECARSYLETISDRLESSAELEAQAKKLTADCADDEEKVAVIVDWIRASFTYKPLEFGRSASIPDLAADTAAYRYGDCKDLSVLLKVLLEAVGVDCDLVLVHTSMDTSPEIITTDQFNHMIAFLPGIRSGLFVDATDQEADALLPVPLGLHERKALILNPASPRLVEIPGLAQDSSTCSIRRSLSMQPGKSVKLEDRVELTGYCASWMRSALKERQKVKWVEWFQSSMADFVTGLEITSVSAENLEDSSQALQLTVSSTLSSRTLPADAGMELDVPPLWVRYYLSFQSVQSRRNPFEINYPLKLDLSVSVDLPEGYSLHRPLLANAAGKSSFIDWKVSDGSRFSGQLKTGEFAADQYAAFIDTMNGSIQAAHVKAKVVKEP